MLHSKDRVLMARAEGASVKLAQMLIKAGITFDDIPLYAVKGVPLETNGRAAVVMPCADICKPFRRPCI